MDPKISFAVFGVLAIITLVSGSVDVEKVMLFKKPFFSSDIKNSKTFKDQLILIGSEYPRGYTKSFNRSRYKFVEACEGLNRSAAQSDCERDSSHLVFIETKEENDFLVGEASHDTKYWIGLFSPKRHLFWDNGHQVTFANFDARNENNFNSKTGCYKMTNDSEERYWLDNPCEKELGFICEYEGSDCPYRTKDSVNNSCYKFVKDFPASHLSAKLKCRNDSSHLVVIESKEENDFLVAKVQKDTEYWIGLHDRPQLFWDDGNKVTFTNIDEDKRSTFDGRTGCYRMSAHNNKFWYDRKCGRTFHYICEYKTDRECSPAYNKSFHGSCYKFVESSNETRDNAQLECERNSSHLVFIETKEENDFLVNQTSPKKQYWIGLLSPKRHLFWDNGHQVTYVNLAGENREVTFDDKTSCYIMSSTDRRSWFGKSCTEKLAFICEYDGPVCMNDTSFNNSCYKFVNDFPATRLSAQLECENDNSHLVFIESEGENNFLVENLAQNGTEYWIGLHDRPQLFWDDGKEASYTNIDAGQDDTFNSRTGCYLMSGHLGNHTWVDKSCGRKFGYICEYEG